MNFLNSLYIIIVRNDTMAILSEDKAEIFIAQFDINSTLDTEEK